MAEGFGHNGKKQAVGTDQLRKQALNRMEAAEKRLGPKDAFANAASSADNMVGNLLFSFITWAPFMEALETGLEATHGEMEAFDTMNNPTLCAAFDGATMLTDEEAMKNRSRRANNFYPEGRRQDRIDPRPVARRFNLVAANENAIFGRDAAAEVACMAQIIEMIDELEKQGVTTLALDPQASVHETLVKVKKGMKSNGALRNFAVPVRKIA